jgi:GTP 3',8-cyclase
MEDLKLDGHKLMYHIERVHRWLKQGDVFPIYIEVGLSGGCNHRCVFCAFDFLEYKPVFLDKHYLKRFIRQAAKSGAKAILFSGEGEPLLHKDLPEILAFAKKNGIDSALVTNGVLLDKELAGKVLKYLSWIKVSLDAGSARTYSVVHGAAGKDFYTVLSNLKEAVKIRNINNYGCTIGVQSLLLPQNIREMGVLAKAIKKTGSDYLVLKPFLPHASSKNKIRFNLKLNNLLALEKELESYSDGYFRVILRKNAIIKLRDKKPYQNCLGSSFAAHLAVTGDLYPCNAFVGIAKYSFGNIYRQGFRDIWKSSRRKKIMSMLQKKIDLGSCRKSCRLDEINRYLWDLKNPGSHVNFI